MDELEIITGMDQAIPIATQEALKNIDIMVNEARRIHEPVWLLDKAHDLLETMRISAHALAKLLYKTQQYWQEFSEDDDFEEVAMERLGLSRATITRYCAVWGMFETKQIPAKLQEDFQQKPMRELVPIGMALSQGYTPNKEQWKQLSEAPNNSTVLEIVREIKGQAPRTGSLTLMIDKKGNITAVQDGEIVDVGFLFFNDMDNDTVSKAIRRIVEHSGIVEKE